MESSGRPLTAKEKRKEQLKRWINSATDVESSVVQNLKPKVKFNNGAVFLAACSSGDLEEVQALIKKGADINYANIDGLTALHQACIDGNFDVVEFLVKKGAEIDQDDNEGWTPLHAATSCGLVDIARDGGKQLGYVFLAEGDTLPKHFMNSAGYLVQKGANVAAVNSEGEVPIDIAEDDEMVEFLQQEIDNQGLDIDRARNSEREDMTVDANQQLNAIRNGQSPEIYRHPKSGASALHVAAAKGYISVIKILLQAGMDVDLRDNDGWTPLHAAAHWSQEEAAKLLADKYANFNLRNKLGQTPCDVADEDMFEYLKELKEEQEKNPRNLKESKFIEPPASFTSPSPNISSIQDVHKEKKPSEKKTIHNHSVASPQKHVSNHDEENSFSSDDVDIDSSSSSEVESSKHSQSNAKEVQEETGDADRFKLSYTIGRTRSSNNMNTSDTVSEITPRLRQSSSGSNVSLNSEFAGRRHNRPASLHIPPTQPKESRPSVMSATENYRPVATTRPIQSSKSSTNGPNAAPSTSTERNIEIKEDSPGTWRSGLRKTGSFDDKMRPVQRGGTTGSFVRHTDAERSASVSTSEDVTNATGNIRTARVAPILDGRITNKLKNEDNEVTTERFSFPRSGSYQRRGSDSSKTTTSAPMTYKRSISYKKAVGRTVSADQTFVTSPRRSSLRSVPDEKLDDQIPSPPSAGDATSFGPSATFELGEPRLDRRRSYLQPVRDEEAEAQRKARSRRERKSRRSTQGVTLDVFEEAKKTIKHMKDERNESAVSSDYSKKPDSSELTVPSGAIPHNDSTTILHRRMGVGASSPRAVTLPSSYIPSNERVASNLTNSSTDIPSINNPDNDEPDKQTTEMKKIRDERPLESSSHRNSTAQQRRRQRKDRRSTGLPGLATESGTDVKDEVTERNSSVSRSGEKGQERGDLNWLLQLGKVTKERRNYCTYAAGDGSCSKGSDKTKRCSSKTKRFKKSSFPVELHPNELRRQSFNGSFAASPVLMEDDSRNVDNDRSEHSTHKPSKSLHLPKLASPFAYSIQNSLARSLDHELNEEEGHQDEETGDIEHGCELPKQTESKLVAAFCRKTNKSVFCANQISLAERCQGSDQEFDAVQNDENKHASLQHVRHVIAEPRKKVEKEVEDIVSKVANCQIKVAYNSLSSHNIQHQKQENKTSTELLSNKHYPETNCSKTASHKGGSSSSHQLSLCTPVFPSGCFSRDESLLKVDDLEGSDDREREEASHVMSYDVEKVKRRLQFNGYNQIISDEEEPRNDDTTELAKAERLRSTASRYDSSSLPDRGSRHRSGLRTSDSDLSRYSTTLDKQESKDFKKLYDDQVAENKRLKNDLSEARRKISELETKLSKIEDPSTQRRAIESERRERRAMERKLAEVEKELLALTELRSDNQRLKDENGALIRVISKLSK